MRHPPLSVIESWPTPNYVNPETRGNSLLVVNIFFFVICFIAVTARLWARLRILHSAGLDDLLITLAIIPVVGVGVAATAAVDYYGWNRHVWDVPFTDFVPSLYMAWWAQLCFLLSAGFTKVSILLFYRRLTAATMHKTFLYVIFGAIGFIVAYTIAFLLVLLVGCRPLSAYWESVLPTYTQPYTCYDEGIALPASQIIGIFIDVIVLALPFSVVWRMQMPSRQKATLSVIFGVGLLAIVAACFRTYYAWQTVRETYDETWVGYDTWLWTSVENDLSIICACAPALKPFFNRYLGNSQSSLGSSQYLGYGRHRIGSTVHGDTLSHSRSHDIELGRSTTDCVAVTEASKSNITSIPMPDIGGIEKHIHVTTKVNVVRDGSMISQNLTDDGESVHGECASSVGSTRDLSKTFK